MVLVCMFVHLPFSLAVVSDVDRAAAVPDAAVRVAVSVLALAVPVVCASPPLASEDDVSG